MKYFCARGACTNYYGKICGEYDSEFVQQVVAQIPWGLNIVILDKITDKSIRRWYIEKTIKNGWSRMFLRIREYSLKDMSRPMGVSEYKVGNV